MYLLAAKLADNREFGLILDPFSGSRHFQAISHGDIASVRIAVARSHQLTLLFDPGSGLDERIFAEQFQV